MTAAKRKTGEGMALLGTGQPFGSVVQTAYIVKDAETAMRAYVARMNVGPWFVAGPFHPIKPLYRGKPIVPHLTLALAYAGTMMIELIEQHDDAPSVFAEVAKSRGYGFHHWAIAVEDFDRAVADYQAKGYEIAFSDTAPMGMRVAYMDTLKELPGMVELIEANAAFEAFFTPMYKASIGWDGRDPIRRL
jgi:hypothetical protein